MNIVLIGLAVVGGIVLLCFIIGSIGCLFDWVGKVNQTTQDLKYINGRSNVWNDHMKVSCTDMRDLGDRLDQIEKFVKQLKELE